MFACSCRIPASPLEAVLNRRIIACSGTRTTAVFARKTSLYLFSAKSTDRSLRLASRSPRNAARKVRILACSGTRTTDSPRARSGRLHSLVLAAPAQRGPEVVPAKATCGWFWYFCHQKYKDTRGHSPPAGDKRAYNNPMSGILSAIGLTIWQGLPIGTTFVRFVGVTGGRSRKKPGPADTKPKK